ncbi:hypothetical protein [Brazilian marseillevirus]|uniref:hypothetical protein n=1 Tax=Brazilian marseillevirus TaxID=1813599 RepID=UPI0007804BB0|nr:hypothetical protein A3303_gp275 [Brazilian marseillevirus]AMQ10783.1 hypothetical protein [Brazilian marseillevirus]
MNAFLVGDNKEKCLELFKEKGSFFDIQRAREKRWEQSGCKNRFSFAFGFDIGDLSKNSVFSKDGTCFVRSDSAFAQKSIGQSFFGGNAISQEDAEQISRLPEEKGLSRELAKIGVKPSSKLWAIREFLTNVGRGLPIPWDIQQEEGKEEVRDTLVSISVLLSLEQQRLIWVPNSHLYFQAPKLLGVNYGGRGSISVNGRQMCFAPSLRKEMKKVRTLPAKVRHVVVLVLVFYGEHANVLVLDRKKKTLSFFEPHGIVSKEKYFQGTKEFLQKFLETFDLIGYKAEYGESTCPWFGPQAREPQEEYRTGYCQTWSDLFVYCKIKFPELSDAEIHYALTHGLTPREIRDRVERFAAFAWDEGKKAAQKSKYHKDDPEKAFFVGTTTRSVFSAPECVNF